MAQVKAKTAVYLGQHGGYRSEGEVFDYSGPEHKHLEPFEEKGEPESEDTHPKGGKKKGS